MTRLTGNLTLSTVTRAHFERKDEQIVLVHRLFGHLLIKDASQPADWSQVVLADLTFLLKLKQKGSPDAFRKLITS